MNRLTLYLQKELKSEGGWYAIAHILIRLRKSSQAENLYKILLDKSSSNAERMVCNDALGIVNHDMGDYAKALSSYQQSLEFRKVALPPNHPDLATSYSNIGAMYDVMGDYTKALSSYQKSLEIRKIALPPNHSDLAISYNNIGAVEAIMSEYTNVLVYLQNAFNVE
ncbi:unnamed protein product [Rotaria socialis]